MRLQELNSIADRLTAMGKTEAAEKIRVQIAVSFFIAFQSCVEVVNLSSPFMNISFMAPL